MIFTDTHTHLYLDQFAEDREATMQRAFDAGVERIFLPAIDRSSFDDMQQLGAAYPDQVYQMIGLHPCSVKADFRDELAFVEQELQKGGYVGIGECGMDLYWDKTFIKEQVIALEQQIEWAKSYDLPIILHTRDAFDEIFEVFDRLNDANLRGIFHCFTGTREQAEHILSYGSFYLGIGGVLTYKKAGLDAVLEHIDLKHMVLETDAPFLTPVPYRGKRNEASYLVHVAQKLADVKGTTLEEVAEITTQNSKSIFGL